MNNVTNSAADAVCVYDNDNLHGIMQKLESIESRLLKLESILSVSSFSDTSYVIEGINNRISAVALATNIFTDEAASEFSQYDVDDLLSDYSFVKTDLELFVSSCDDVPATDLSPKMMEHVSIVVKEFERFSSQKKSMLSEDVSKICNVTKRHALTIMRRVVESFPDRYILHQVRLNPRSKRTRWVLEIKDAAGVVA